MEVATAGTNLPLSISAQLVATSIMPTSAVEITAGLVWQMARRSWKTNHIGSIACSWDSNQRDGNRIDNGSRPSTACNSRIIFSNSIHDIGSLIETRHSKNISFMLHCNHANDGNHNCNNNNHDEVGSNSNVNENGKHQQATAA